MVVKWSKGAEGIIDSIFDDSLEIQTKYTDEIMNGSEFALQFEEDYDNFTKKNLDKATFQEKYRGILP